MMPNLIPPKIPDGEKVDFDVSDRLALHTVHRFLPDSVKTMKHKVQKALNPCFCRISIVKGWRRT